jgi:hypothetical protein
MLKSNLFFALVVATNIILSAIVLFLVKSYSQIRSVMFRNSGYSFKYFLRDLSKFIFHIVKLQCKVDFTSKNFGSQM